MRTLLFASAILVLSSPALAVEWHFGVKFDNGRVSIGNDGIKARIGYPERRHHRRYKRRPVYIVYPGTRAVDAAAEPPQEATPPPEPVESKPAAVPETPPDPAGAASRYRARGVGKSREWAIGDFLPPTVPHVKLAAQTYGLPPEPEGQIYARVRGDLLLIDAVTRRVEAIVRN